MNRMSFEPVRNIVDRRMSLARKIIGYKMRTINQLIYKGELLKNMAIKICHDVRNTNPNSIYILINVCSKGYNR